MNTYKKCLAFIFFLTINSCIDNQDISSYDNKNLNPINQDEWVNTPEKTKQYLKENNIKITDNDLHTSKVDVEDFDWIKSFHDKQLESFVKKALNKNYDLEIAYTKLKESLALAKKAGADLFPFVDIGAGYLTDNNFDTGKYDESFRNFLDVSWEVDVWGRINSNKKATNSEFKATSSDFKYAIQSIAGQTIKSYLLAIESKRQLNLAKYNLKSYQETLNVTQSFFEEGLTSIQDVHLAKSEKALSENDLVKAKTTNLEALRSLEILLTEYPAGKIKVPDHLPKMPKSFSLGVPSEILERRPDIIAAERRISKTIHSLSSAKAARLPRISIKASLEAKDNSLKNMFDPVNILWNLTNNVVFPLIDSGKLEQDVNISKARVEEAVALYRKTALNAFKNVENSLYKEKVYRKRLKSLSEAYLNSKEAEDIALENYKSGEGNILDVQQLQRNTINSHVSLLTIESELLIERVNLYLELGGSFRSSFKDTKYNKK